MNSDPPFLEFIDVHIEQPKPLVWTNELGSAVLAEVMDAVQRMRRKAQEFGYLRPNQIIVSDGPYITMEPVDPDFIVVPVYDPLIVFAPPRPGFVAGGAIVFGFGVTLVAWFRPWGWGGCRTGWGEHAIFINNVRWERTRANRGVYRHGYPGIDPYAVANRVEHHDLIRRSAEERAAARGGHTFHEEHDRH